MYPEQYALQRGEYTTNPTEYEHRLPQRGWRSRKAGGINLSLSIATFFFSDDYTAAYLTILVKPPLVLFFY